MDNELWHFLPNELVFNIIKFMAPNESGLICKTWFIESIKCTKNNLEKQLGIKLRDHQIKLIKHYIKSDKSIVNYYNAPYGFGKTIVTLFLAYYHLNLGRNVIVLFPYAKHMSAIKFILQSYNLINNRIPEISPILYCSTPNVKHIRWIINNMDNLNGRLIYINIKVLRYYPQFISLRNVVLIGDEAHELPEIDYTLTILRNNMRFAPIFLSGNSIGKIKSSLRKENYEINTKIYGIKKKSKLHIKFFNNGDRIIFDKNIHIKPYLFSVDNINFTSNYKFYIASWLKLQKEYCKDNAEVIYQIKNFVGIEGCNFNDTNTIIYDKRNNISFKKILQLYGRINRLSNPYDEYYIYVNSHITIFSMIRISLLRFYDKIYEIYDIINFIHEYKIQEIMEYLNITHEDILILPFEIIIFLFTSNKLSNPLLLKNYWSSDELIKIYNIVSSWNDSIDID